MTTQPRPSTTPQAPSTAPQAPAAPITGDVLQSDHHSHFTTEEIAKAVARHQREHPGKAPRAARPQKTTPRR
jgi:hypothetical protein